MQSKVHNDLRSSSSSSTGDITPTPSMQSMQGRPSTSRAQPPLPCTASGACPQLDMPWICNPADAAMTAMQLRGWLLGHGLSSCEKPTLALPPCMSALTLHERVTAGVTEEGPEQSGGHDAERVGNAVSEHYRVSSFPQPSMLPSTALLSCRGGLMRLALSRWRWLWASVVSVL